jgi:hypothetical protein
MHPLDGRHQPIPALRDGLDEPGLGCMVPEDVAQLRDRSGEHRLGHELPGPHRGEDLFVFTSPARLRAAASISLGRTWTASRPEPVELSLSLAETKSPPIVTNFPGHHAVSGVNIDPEY